MRAPRFALDIRELSAVAGHPLRVRLQRRRGHRDLRRRNEARLAFGDDRQAGHLQHGPRSFAHKNIEIAVG